ncbi:MAG: tetratricopeptide repeat protein [Phycisphaerae bacterium]
MNGFKKVLPPDHWILAVAMLNLGRCQAALGDYSTAEQTLLDAHVLLENTLGTAHARSRQVRVALTELYDAWGKPEQAEAWRDAK